MIETRPYTTFDAFQEGVRELVGSEGGAHMSIEMAVKQVGDLLVACAQLCSEHKLSLSEMAYNKIIKLDHKKKYGGQL